MSGITQDELDRLLAGEDVGGSEPSAPEPAAAPEAPAAKIEAAPEIPAAPATEDEKPRTSATSREVPVSTIVHLLGVPTQQDIRVLESKIDMLSSKLTAVALKLDRVAGQVATMANEFYLDRIDFQISDIRALMRKVFPQFVGASESNISLKDAVEGRQKEKPASDPSGKTASKTSADAASAKKEKSAETKKSETTTTKADAASTAAGVKS